MSFIKKLLSEDGAVSSMRLVRLIFILIFILDWIFTRFIRCEQFTPSWEIVSLVSGIIGISVVQKYIENKYPKEYDV